MARYYRISGWICMIIGAIGAIGGLWLTYLDRTLFLDFLPLILFFPMQISVARFLFLRAKEFEGKGQKDLVNEDPEVKNSGSTESEKRTTLRIG